MQTCSVESPQFPYVTLYLICLLEDRWDNLSIVVWQIPIKIDNLYLIQLKTITITTGIPLIISMWQYMQHLLSRQLLITNPSPSIGLKKSVDFILLKFPGQFHICRDKVSKSGTVPADPGRMACMFIVLYVLKCRPLLISGLMVTSILSFPYNVLKCHIL